MAAKQNVVSSTSATATASVFLLLMNTSTKGEVQRSAGELDGRPVRIIIN